MIELLAGHPEHIHCELSVHHHDFIELVSVLLELGHSNSRYVSLEEQLAIFYASVTSLCYVGSASHLLRVFPCISVCFSLFSVLRLCSRLFSVPVRGLPIPTNSLPILTGSVTNPGPDPRPLTPQYVPPHR